jgi:hypothetical protein
MAVIRAEQVTFNSQKAAMLTFNLVSEQRAKNQVLFLHSQVLMKFLNTMTKRLQQLHDKWKADAQKSEDFIEFIGSIYFTMNKIQQI